jgi:tRNA(Arg) A34 adenosine deaminase TadA
MLTAETAKAVDTSREMSVMPVRAGATAPDGEEDMILAGLSYRDPSKGVVRLEYPEWVQHEDFWHRDFDNDGDKMALAIDISRKNMSHGTGGPFGAAIFNSANNQLVSVGMSMVELGNNCCLHAEMVAIQMATAIMKSSTLDSEQLPPHELFASSEPCAMCIGAILWCGVSKLVCAATDVDVRSLLHDTGPVFEESFRYLQSKGILIHRKFMRSEAKQVLCEYSVIHPAHNGRQV